MKQLGQIQMMYINDSNDHLMLAVPHGYRSSSGWLDYDEAVLQWGGTTNLIDCPTIKDKLNDGYIPRDYGYIGYSSQSGDGKELFFTYTANNKLYHKSFSLV